MYENLALIGAAIFFYSILSGYLERTPINGATVFLIVGLILGSLGLNFLDLHIEAEGIRILAELTLALVLFTDAANANLKALKANPTIPTRLLLIGLPLTILLGYLSGTTLFPELGVFEVAVLATMLAPTDAALGKAVVTDKSVPTDIREGLNVESGLNDGICVPVLFVFLALATHHHVEGGTGILVSHLFLEEIGIGAAVGICVTLLASKLIKTSMAEDLITHSWKQLPVVSIALICFALAQYLGGSGFIASFVGGLLFGALMKEKKEELLISAESTGDTIGLITWIVFGAVVVGQYIHEFTWQIVTYSLLSLTIIRILPAFIALSGTGLSTHQKLFIGWFGPRGLASIVFGVIVLEEQLPGGGVLTLTVVCTVILSILAHGLSANLLVARIAKSQR